MATITVIGKDDLGHSPKFGDIRKGQKYTIEETDFAPELFTPPKGFDVSPYLPQAEPVEQPEPTQVQSDKTNQEVL